MRRLLSAIVISCLTLPHHGQGPVGSWKDRLSYSSSLSLAVGDDKVFSSAGAAVLVYDIPSRSTSSVSRVTGLNETLVNAVAWCEEEETLIIIYRNTSVDLLRKGIVTNIPDIKNKYIPGLKEIYGVTVAGSMAMLSGSFGIVVLDIRGRYVADTWRPGSDGEVNAVAATAILGDRVYATTATGIFSAPLSRPGLSYFGNWERLEGLPSPVSSYNGIATAGTALFISKPGSASSADSLFRIIPGENATLIHTSPGGSMRSVSATGNSICLATTSALRMFSGQGTLQREITGYGPAAANPVTAAITGQTLWVADASSGLVSTDDYATYVSHTLPGPYTNNVADIHFAGDNFYVTGGTVDNAWGNVYRPLQVFTGTGDRWRSTILYLPEDRDAMRVIADPDDASHYFVSSWGNGLYEFREGDMVMNYNQENSPLSSIIPGENFTRICGLAYDREGNLWMTQSGVPGILKALTPDGNWISTTLSLGVPVAGDMVIDRNGFIWVTLPRGYGLLVYDPAGTPETLTNDRYLRLQVTDTEGHVLNNIFSVTTDNDGSIWLGTDMGPAVFYNPGKAFTGELKATRIKIPRNDGSGLADYLLGTETVTSICVDGANRKWFGTMSSGAWLMSDDAREELIHFNSRNSPLLSDNIVKINVNPVTGEVWFGTSEGIISFRGDATAGKEDFSSIYVFPNPVREDFEGVVTVTGLVENSSVKITDISGNLVYETTSTGGQATWDLHNYRSERVTTGVYLVFCSNEDGSLAKVTKMLVIR
ncbi:MAG: T9SS type A sorting domain-containing protein [Bacteroidales bacterium]|nr:T9SS type A sorting domain-containing protein [Bacteroidales bacterium]MDT8373307.1 T9SS type A sorting domain-containing protein [Bacteroidales bacterium]